MKKFSIILPLFVAMLSFFACEKEEDNVVINATPAANEMTALSKAAFTYQLEDAAKVFETFKWSAVDYGFQASVTYTLQLDKKGADQFKNPIELGSTNALELAVLVSDFNKILLDREFEIGTVANFVVRVKATINASVPAIYSAVKEFTFAPYATSFPPIYMCGQATGGWDWTKGVEVPSVAPSQYAVIAYFVQNEAFRFFKQANWDPVSWNYPYFTTVTPMFENAQDGDKNFKFLQPTGYYKVEVNMKTKTVAMTKVDEPLLYMTGAGTGGWNWTGSQVKMKWLRDGVFQATTNFISGEAFRFFAQADWGPVSYNYPYFKSVDAKFVNAEDGDKNLRVNTPTGLYKVTVDLNAKTVTLAAADVAK